MVHLLFERTLYLNIDEGVTISSHDEFITISYKDKSFDLNLYNHPKIQEVVDALEEKDQKDILRLISFEVLKLIIDRLNKKDENLPTIFNLEGVLFTLEFKDKPTQEPTKVIPVTVNKEGEITNVEN